MHYAWTILIVSFLALVAVAGSRSAFGAFVEPLEQDLAVGRGAVTSIGMIAFVAYGLGQPIIGRMLDRWNPRWVLTAGMLATGMAFLLTGLTTQLWQLQLLQGVTVGLGSAAGPALVGSVLVTRWFRARRGLALGILSTGFSLGQAVMVPLVLLGVSALGWRPTMAAIGAGMVMLLAPLLFGLVRAEPAEKGLAPLGAAADGTPGPDRPAGGTAAGAAAPGWAEVLGALRSPPFWCLAVPYFICGVTTTGLIDTHLIPYAHDHGFSPGVTATAVSLLAILNTAGTLASGWLSDKVSKRGLLAWIYAVRGLSLFFLLSVRDPLALFLFSAVFGLADFSTVAPTTALVGEHFGQRSLGFFYGLVSLSHQLGSALGAYLPGRIYDLTGSYQLAFVGAAGALMVATVLSYLTPERRRAAPAKRPVPA